MNIIITGASRGIGFETALELALQPGNRVLALARSEHGLKKLSETCPNNAVDYLVFDVHQPDLTSLVHKVEGMGGVDVLVNNAAILIRKPFLELEMQDWDLTFSVNLLGPVKLMKTLHPYLLNSKTAHIVNISSMGGFQGAEKFAGLSAYSATKAALGNLTECLAVEMAKDGITVNCLCLGAVNTGMLAMSLPGYEAGMQPNDMAKFIAYFALHGRQYFNGKVLPVSLGTP